MTTDTERLNWLEANDGLLNFADRGPHVCLRGLECENVHFYGKDFRDAIDTAMREYVMPAAFSQRAPFIKSSFRNAEGPFVIMSDDTGWIYKDGAWSRQ